MSEERHTDGRKVVTRDIVHAWHLDHYGHMNARWYAHFFDDAAFLAFAQFGVEMQRLWAEHSVHTVSAQATISFIKELRAGDLVRIDGAITRLGTKSVTLQLRMVHETTGEVHAIYDLVEVFFDPESRTSAAIPADVRRRLEAHVVAG